MTFATWAIFLAVCILPAMSPGPGILLAITNSIRFGPSATVYSAMGNSLGIVLMGLAVSFGLAALMATSAYAFTVIKIAGAVYLFYLGLKLWFTGKGLDFGSAYAGPQKSKGKLFREALLLALTNPKALVLVAALLPPFLNHDFPLFPQAAILSITFASLCFCNHLFLAFAGSKVRRFLSSEKRVLAVRRALGSLFIGFGAALVFASR